MKRCVDCKTEKPLDQFSKNAGQWDGKDQLCKPCRSVRNKEYRMNNKEYLRDYTRRRRAAIKAGTWEPREYVRSSDTETK